FPVGKNSIIRWAELKNATGNFTIEFMHTDPRTLSSTYGTGIDHISSNDYWQIDADVSPSASANVELSFANAINSGVTDMATLRIAQLSAGTWTDKNNISTTGSAGASGSVVSGTISSFNSSDNSFALASNTGSQNPLPVKLTSFSATKYGNVVLLNWQIDTPKDAAYFTVMYSSNNQDFSSIAKIDAADFQTSYQYTDEHPANGIIYYRLRITEKNGNSHLSKVVSINNNAPALGLHFTSYMLVQNSIGINVTSPAEDKLQLLLINSDGKVMKNIFMQLSTGDNRLILDLSGIASGVYYVTGQNHKQRTNVLRFIKQ
ncbi:MAG: hypothetical protein JST96_18610, partial [Bacteroidetes bacterium]|nr:hypothetical protein [Bacteroidota bacterium]